MRPEHPIYIVSKGRWESRLTAKALDLMGVPYSVVIEEQEYAQYAAVIGKHRLVVLDKRYQREYDTFDDLGDTKSKGPGAARNFAWEHSKSKGHAWHWVMDDNIRDFRRFNRNERVTVADGTIIKCMEDFTKRYTNVVMAGPSYYMFAPNRKVIAPIAFNTRIYSCNFIRNDIPFRWRGRYNEDTDLSLQILKAGLCTVEFYAFLQLKSPTQTIAGGCHADFYASEGTLPKSAMLEKMHPDVARVIWKYGRWHHFVDYLPFKGNRPIRRAGLEVKAGADNYGMVLKNIKTGEYL